MTNRAMAGFTLASVSVVAGLNVLPLFGPKTATWEG